MNRKTSTLLSTGVSAGLIAVAIWFLYNDSISMWMGSNHWGMEHSHMMGSGMGIIMIIFWIVFIGALVLLISGAINGFRGTLQNDDNAQTPLKILELRYARGEIDRKEYEAKRRDFTA
jgi:putative membrane protein